MRITRFKIENYKNIKFAEIKNLPNLMVISGINGSGKSALLNALMVAKETAATYGDYPQDSDSISKDSDQATIEIDFSLNDAEREYAEQRTKAECPPSEGLIVQLNRDSQSQVLKMDQNLGLILKNSEFSKGKKTGFIDFIGTNRGRNKRDLANLDTNVFNPESILRNLATSGRNKFEFTKHYLVNLKLKDLQSIQDSMKSGTRSVIKDSLQPVRKFFNDFLSPKTFIDVNIASNPFKFEVATNRGIIDIDDLSDGEKEILNLFIRYLYLKPIDSIILYDEPDAHLHPSLQRQYLELLRNISKDNQIILTTHAPEIMIIAGYESLYMMTSDQKNTAKNQISRVSDSNEMHEVLLGVMGTRGVVGLNKKIIFIEGKNSSADRAIYERYYPPVPNNIEFIPAGDSFTVRKTAERINALLEAGTGYQEYYCIIDGDLDKVASDPGGLIRLFKLPVYHIENFLLDDKLILKVTKDMLGEKCPYSDSTEVEEVLKRLVLEDTHLEYYSRALFSSELEIISKKIQNAVFKNFKKIPGTIKAPSFRKIKKTAKMHLKKSIMNNGWRNICIGRTILKSYCGLNNLNYMHFRNSIIAKLRKPPTELKNIMNTILK